MSWESFHAEPFRETGPTKSRIPKNTSFNTFGKRELILLNSSYVSLKAQNQDPPIDPLPFKSLHCLQNTLCASTLLFDERVV